MKRTSRSRDPFVGSMRTDRSFASRSGSPLAALPALRFALAISAAVALFVGCTMNQELDGTPHASPSAHADGDVPAPGFGNDLTDAAATVGRAHVCPISAPAEGDPCTYQNTAPCTYSTSEPAAPSREESLDPARQPTPKPTPAPAPMPTRPDSVVAGFYVCSIDHRWVGFHDSYLLFDDKACAQGASCSAGVTCEQPCSGLEGCTKTCDCHNGSTFECTRS